MTMEFTNLFVLLLLALSLPVGFLIAYLARDELIMGRIWFKRIMALGICALLVLFFLKEFAGALTCAFIIVVAYISYRKSFDATWTKKAFK